MASAGQAAQTKIAMKEHISMLVLEDSADDFFLLKEMLESSAEIIPVISHAESFENAIAMVQEQSFDIAILDLQLPDSFGLDTFLSFQKRNPLIPVIILTAMNDVEMAMSCVKKGAQDYIHKSETSPISIVRTIRYAIERQGMIKELQDTQKQVQLALEESKVRVMEVEALLQGAKTVLDQSDFKTTARKVFDICSTLIGAASGYVALLSEDGSENEVLFLEAGESPCTVDPELPMPIRGLRERAYRTNATVYENSFMTSEWEKYMPEGHVRLENVLFAPLVINGKTVGVIGLANKKEDFTENDAKIASGFGELVAIALQNSRNLEKRDVAETKNLDLIKDLREALANVKQLRGMLPICMHCKEIRNDKGYWIQIEEYISNHSEVQFSHGICEKCLAEHYPEYTTE